VKLAVVGVGSTYTPPVLGAALAALDAAGASDAAKARLRGELRAG
jgi:hypothetical protein